MTFIPGFSRAPYDSPAGMNLPRFDQMVKGGKPAEADDWRLDSQAVALMTFRDLPNVGCPAIKIIKYHDWAWYELHPTKNSN